MDSASLFLTGNCDTVYFLSFMDLSDGPMVLDVPPLGPPSGILGTIDDMWFRWVTDFGLPGPDRAQGGRYLIVGPGYEGPLPDGGFYVSHARTTRAVVLGRAFMVNGDPGPAVEAIREGVRISPYVPAAGARPWRRSSPARSPTLAPVAPVAEQRFIEGSGVSFNTIAPERLRLLGDRQRAGAAGAGRGGRARADGDCWRAVGIVKGTPFAPDERMRKVLEDAVVVGNATARTIAFAPREEEGFAVYPGSWWINGLWVGGYEFLDPPPQITAEGVVPSPSDGARKLNSRIWFLYPATGVTPAMCMRLTGIGSQYLIAMRGGDGEFLDGGRELPAHPAGRHPAEPLLVGDPLRPPDALDAADRPAEARPQQPAGGGRGQPRRLDRHLHGAQGAQGQGRQLAPDRPRQGLLRRSCGSTTRCSRSSTRPGDPSEIEPA